MKTTKTFVVFLILTVTLAEEQKIKNKFVGKIGNGSYNYHKTEDIEVFDTNIFDEKRHSTEKPLLSSKVGLNTKYQKIQAPPRSTTAYGENNFQFPVLQSHQKEGEIYMSSTTTESSPYQIKIDIPSPYTVYKQLPLPVEVEVKEPLSYPYTSSNIPSVSTYPVYVYSGISSESSKQTMDTTLPVPGFIQRQLHMLRLDDYHRP